MMATASLFKPTWTRYILITLTLQAIITLVAKLVLQRHALQHSQPASSADHQACTISTSERNLHLYLDRTNLSLTRTEQQILTYQTNSHFVYIDNYHGTIATDLKQEFAALESSSWAPIALTKCKAGMPLFWAPCAWHLNPTYISYAEELIFPDFKMDYPKFPNSTSPGSSSEDQMEFFLTEMKSRADMRDRNVAIYEQYLVYRGQHAQNLIVKDATYLAHPPASWDPSGCMGKRTDYNMLAKSAEYRITKHSVKSAVIVQTPEHYIFQHFLDRATHLLEQSYHLFDQETIAIIQSRRQRVVDDMFKYYGFENDDFFEFQNTGLRAERMIFACRTLLLHPWYALRFQERFGVKRHVPAVQRKYVLFLSRAGLRRPLINEDELVASIEAFLKRRNRGEKLIMLLEIQKRSPALQDMILWINQNVIALVGAHGGGFYNHRWASQNTLLVEIMPKTRTFVGFFEEAYFLRQHYFMFLTNSTVGEDKTSLTTEDIEAIIRTFQWFFESNEKNATGMETHMPVTVSYDWNSDAEGYNIIRDGDVEYDPATETILPLIEDRRGWKRNNTTRAFGRKGGATKSGGIMQKPEMDVVENG